MTIIRTRFFTSRLKSKADSPLSLSEGPQRHDGECDRLEPDAPDVVVRSGPRRGCPRPVPTIRIDGQHGPSNAAAAGAAAAEGGSGGAVGTRELFIHAAVSELARLAGADSRVVAISSAIDEETTAAWSGPRERMFLVDSGVPHALEWSASVAAGGGRPFVFISWDELQTAFGQVREYLPARAAVTLVVEGRRDVPAEQCPRRPACAGCGSCRTWPWLLPRTRSNWARCSPGAPRRTGPRWCGSTKRWCRG